MAAVHLVALPHTQVSPRFNTCAYTQKVWKFLKMQRGRGRRVILYSPESDLVDSIDNVTLMSDQQRKAMFGPSVETAMPFWPTDDQWAPYNKFAIAAIKQRAEPGDLLALVGGWSQHTVAEALPELVTCEPFVGYEGIFSSFCAFESYAWRHHIYAKKAAEGAAEFKDGRWFDTVIPNFFDPADFVFNDDPAGRDYLLFIGRVTRRKGPDVAAAVAEAAGLRLVVAGPGVTSYVPGRIEGDGVALIGEHCEYVGQVDVHERADLMAGARAVLCPTLYIEPFCGVAVEAMMCGTPVLTTDWGAFTETVLPGTTGYRFATLQDAVEKLQLCADLDPHLIQLSAFSRYSLSAVAPQFDRWFDRLDTLNGDGWYHREPSLLAA